MSVKGNLLKMKVEYHQPIQYTLVLGDDKIPMNDFIGKEISFSFNGQINCISCGRLTNKSFAGGFCFPCMQSAPENSECIIRPELCLAHEGKGRDPEWEEKNHLQPHVVYLALSSNVKVGVTRESQIPTRWIDQGANKAIRLAEVPNRYLAGKIEVFLKDHFKDKTSWQKMLKNDVDMSVQLNDQKKIAKDLIQSEFGEYISSNNEELKLEFPVESYPEKVSSMTFDKFPEVKGKLTGIKGQYLIFNEGKVLNIRRHSGYFIIFQS